MRTPVKRQKWRTFYKGKPFGYVFGDSADDAAAKVRNMNPSKLRDDFRVKFHRWEVERP